MSAPPTNEVGTFPAPAAGSELRARSEPAQEVAAPASVPHVVRFDWRKNAVLFALTVVSVFFVGQLGLPAELQGAHRWLAAWTFAVPLLFILLCHEFGHYIAARVHRVPASLPYFLPLPVLNPFGTLGAIILMPERIRSRKALLDIGAAGPLAGMVVAIPIMLWGLSLSELVPRPPADVGARLLALPVQQEGQSLLYAALKYAVFGHIPSNMDVLLHPTAFAAWAGFFVTFLNLLPFGQLDGGHVAYAVFGERQNRAARWVMWLPLALALYAFAVHVVPVLAYGANHGFGRIFTRIALEGDASPGMRLLEYFLSALLLFNPVLNWAVLLLLLRVLRRVAGPGHPPVDDPTLSAGRRAIGIVTLALFVLLFMPTPWVAL
jgi:membrane-associated protease RseP (regulator of RpoE activity)